MGLFLFLLLFFSVQAEVISLPSNTTQIQSTGFRIEGSTLTGQKLVPLADSLIQSTTAQLKVPIRSTQLTRGIADIYQSFNVSGTATQVIPSNSLNLKSSQIACISCDQDDYTGNIRVDETIEYVTSAQSAAAILLYSKTATGCNFTSDDQTAARYPNIFTFTTRGGYSALLGAFDRSTTISIVSMSYLSGVPSDNDAGGTSDSPNTGSYPDSSTSFNPLTYPPSHDHPVQYHGYNHRPVPGYYHHGCSPGSSPSRAIWPSPDCRASAAKPGTRYSASDVRHYTGRQV